MVPFRRGSDEIPLWVDSVEKGALAAMVVVGGDGP
jgi:hypothetical protein